MYIQLYIIILVFAVKQENIFKNYNNIFISFPIRCFGEKYFNGNLTKTITAVAHNYKYITKIHNKSYVNYSFC